jgi:NifU-like protein involved in Fe-S cluster formation
MLSEPLRELFHTAKHIGPLTPGANIHKGQSGDSDHADWARFYLHLDGQIIRELRFNAYGSPALIGACEWLCRELVEQPVAAIKDMRFEMLTSALLPTSTQKGALIRALTALNKCADSV